MKQMAPGRIFLLAALCADLFGRAVCGSNLLWKTPTQAISGPVFNSDGSRIFRGSEDGVYVFDTATSSLLQTLPASVCFAPGDPASIALLAPDGTLRIVRIEDGSVAHTYENVSYRNVSGLDFLANGAVVYSGINGSSAYVAPASDEAPVKFEVGSNAVFLVTGNLFLVRDDTTDPLGSSRVDLQACKLEYSIVSPK